MFGDFWKHLKLSSFHENVDLIWQEGRCEDWSLQNEIYVVLEVAIHNFPLPRGLQVINTASSLSFAVFSWSTACISSSPLWKTYMWAPVFHSLSNFLSYHLRITSNLYSSFPFHIQQHIYTGDSSFPLSHLLSIHTPIHCLLPRPPFHSTLLPLFCSVCFASAQ